MSPVGAHTKLYCVFGSPVRHSLSPRMHNAAFSFLDIDAIYLAFEPSTLAGALVAMRALPIHGASITIPYKTEILPHLDSVDELSLKIGSVNTVCYRDGLLHGCSTDGHGALLALTRNGVSPDGASVLILGNGGSARAIAFTLLHEGARVTIAGRNESRIAGLAGELAHYYRPVSCRPLGALDRVILNEVDVVINTTPLGMDPDTGSLPMDASLLSSRHTVMDIVYAPARTALLLKAAEYGCRTIQGHEMLLYQGVRQFELWTGQSAPVELMRGELLKATDAGNNALPS